MYSMMVEENIPTPSFFTGTLKLNFICIALPQFCSSATHFFWFLFPTLIPYPSIHLFYIFSVVDIVRSTKGDVWDEVAPSPTHLFQKIIDNFYIVNEEDVFVVKRRYLMDPMDNGIYKGEGAGNAFIVESKGEEDGIKEGLHESHKGSQDSDDGHNSSDGE